jgi:hypothetical protein
MGLIVTGIVVAILLSILILRYWNREDFSSREDKANAILRWFIKDTSPTYIEYRRDIEGDIVEYTDVSRLCAGGRPACTLKNIEKLI